MTRYSAILYWLSNKVKCFLVAQGVAKLLGLKVLDPWLYKCIWAVLKMASNLFWNLDKRLHIKFHRNSLTTSARSWLKTSSYIHSRARSLVFCMINERGQGNYFVKIWHWETLADLQSSSFFTYLFGKLRKKCRMISKLDFFWGDQKKYFFFSTFWTCRWQSTTIQVFSSENQDKVLIPSKSELP